ncbi:MAG TPA: DUF2336 domain-containing protein [Candidatus Binatia bacterium]|nr:DUF2336 domain-containing protein [Candidatus Binatia bacterium]
MIALAYLSQEDVDRLAADRSPATRQATMLRVGEVLASGVVGVEERLIAYAIIDRVLPEAEIEVRAELSKFLKHVTWLDHRLAQRLANDVLEVAEPILAESLALTDEDLLAVIDSHSIGHARAIAKRPKISAPVSTALIKTEDEVCVLRVASNDNAAVEVGSLHRLLDRFAENQPVVEAVSTRSMLPLAIVERLTAVVGGKVLQRLIERYDLPAHRVSRLIQHGREHVLLTSFALDQSADEIRTLVDRLADNKLLTTSLIIRALCLGNFTFLVPALAMQARIPTRNVRLLIADESGRGAERLFEHCGFEPRLKPLFTRLIELSRNVRSRRFGFAPTGWRAEVLAVIDEELGGANAEQSFDQRVTEVLMRLENGQARARGPEVSPMRSASAE